MKTLTQTFEEILADYQDTKYDIDQKSLEKLIQAVKARDEEVLGEEEEISSGSSGEVWSTTARYILQRQIEQKMEETL